MVGVIRKRDVLAHPMVTIQHLSYVNERVPAIDPSLTDACRAMMDKHGTCPAKS